jgi:hypothetical protein
MLGIPVVNIDVQAALADIASLDEWLAPEG